jgi:hypothetical protein
MDLFAAAGIDPGDGNRAPSRPGRALARTLRVPLFNHRVIADARKAFTFDPSEQQRALARSYAETARNPRFARQKETAVRNRLFDDVLGSLLGYEKYDAARDYSLAFEHPIRGGFVDVALGRFSAAEGKNAIVAPFELKGPGTHDLDAIPPGGRRSPVQQAWDYAIDAPGSRWVLVSNCVEIRLYAFGAGRDAYELFDLRRLDDEEEHARLSLILSAAQLLTGKTEALLRETDNAYRTITDDLYRQYTELRQSVVQFLTGSADGPKLALAAAIEPAQKILDRILFIAFAQRTALLPDRLLERAKTAENEFRPVPIWHNFQGLFRSVDKGNPRLNIWPYNGGLFSEDPIADAVELPDALAENLAKLGEWDYRNDVPVTLLGHLFEQSVTDLEKLRADARGEPAPPVTKRKKEGVVYTPDFVTRFLAERTIGLALAERFDALLRQHGKGDAPRENGAKLFGEDEQEEERAFWRDYLAGLHALTIVDPACGSGAFLVAAYDLLAAEYRRVVARLDDLGEAIDFDPLDEIVTKNLYGVDINAESVEITRLALWLKTARSQHRLQNLEATIKVGDSLIADKKYTRAPFDWRAAFPDVFAQGGFDIVIGNPPYVRMELIKPVKPYLEQHYVVAADRADLYAYFFERGVGLLNDGGRLGYISSSTFFRTGSGENLRKFLGDNVAIESVVDFGDLQLFEGVTTYPAILTLRKGADSVAGQLAFLKVEENLPKDLSAAFIEQARPMARARLGAGSWQFEDEPLARLRDKIVGGRKTLGEVYGAPLRGIVTGLNEAFVIDTATRNRLVAADPKSAELLKPFLRGENVKRWRVEPEGLFLINTPKGKVDIDRYPAVRDWLLPFKPDLEKRATQQEWWELQQAQLAYQQAMRDTKILYPEFSQGPKFSFDGSGSLVNNKCFFLPGSSELLALLNSRAAWFWIFGQASPLRGGKWRLELREQHMSTLPIPSMPANGKKKLAIVAEACISAAVSNFRIQAQVCHRILDLAPPERRKLTRKLEHWWELDFGEFRAEVKRAFRTEIPVKERGDWEGYLAENAAAVRALTAEIEQAEREIDAIVYRLFDLTPEEIALLEASLAGQY